MTLFQAIYCFFIEIYYTQAKAATKNCGVSRKEEENKEEKHIEKPIKKHPKIKGTYSLQTHSDHNSKKNIPYAKICNIQLYMEKIVGIGLLITSRKIMESIRMASGPSISIRKGNQFSQFG